MDNTNFTYPTYYVPELVWSDTLATGDARMDATHQEFIELANALLNASNDGLLTRLQAFEAHAQAHFAEEDRMMRQQPYPSAGCHLDEHQAVLKSIAEVMPLVAAGNVRIGRELAAELVRWFPEHTEEMDKSFVRWLVRQATGGAPVLFHRSRPAQANASGRTE